MRRLRKVTSDEVFQAMLRSEWDYSNPHQKDESLRGIAFSRDFNDEQQNRDRRQLLQYRDPIIRRVPEDTDWWEVECDEESFLALNVIKDGGWSFISGGNGSLEKASRCILDMKTKHVHPMMPVLDPSGRLMKIIDLHTHVDKVGYILPELEEDSFDTHLISLKSELSGLSTLLDGNHRGVAILIRHFINKDLRDFFPFKMYEGETSQPCVWCW